MKAKELEDVCEQLEYMASIGRDMIKGLYSEAEVPIRVGHEDRDRHFIHLAGFMWALRPEAKGK